jgi:hypothetical protein
MWSKALGSCFLFLPSTTYNSPMYVQSCIKQFTRWPSLQLPLDLLCAFQKLERLGCLEEKRKNIKL